MREIVLASQNENKVMEIRHQLPEKYIILSLNDIGHQKELEESQTTLEGNALQKARFVKEKLGYDCFADDTGLEVKSLNGNPGVHSARYAGDEKDANKNMQKLLSELEGKTDRRARFKTVIALILDDREYLFEGICEGEIISQPRGNQGFGYDPIFVPEGYQKTFAEMSLDLKAEIGHRGKAIHKFANFMESL